jgi:hypothetical protein
LVVVNLNAVQLGRAVPVHLQVTVASRDGALVFHLRAALTVSVNNRVARRRVSLVFMVG